MVAHADQAGPQLVLLGIATQLRQRGRLVERSGQRQLTLQTDGRRYRLVDQLIAAAQAQGLEHRLLLAGIRPEVAPQEGVRLLKL